MENIKSAKKVGGVSPLDPQGQKKTPPVAGGVQMQKNIRINRSPEACYRYWRNFDNLPNIMKHVEAVSVIDDRRSHWTVNGPADSTAEWDAEIIEDIPNERISWRSLPGSQIENAGSVSFAASSDGQTEVKVSITYNPPLGALGVKISHLFGEDPLEELKDGLESFKKVLEHTEPPVTKKR